MKLLSFSLYGQRLIYLIGAIEILKEQLYPGWHCRFYVAEDMASSVIEELSAGGAEVIIMRPEPGVAGTLWRYLPADEDEENLEACLMLDVDSPLLERGKRATDEWLSGDKSYHVIRDHPAHKSEIMAGLFGMKYPSPIILNMRQEIEDFIFRQPGRVMKNYLDDQIFLANRIYPRIKEHTLFHVDSDCMVFPGEIARPLPGPKRIQSYFMGNFRRRIPLKEWRTLIVISIKHFQVKDALYFSYKLLAYCFISALRKMGLHKA